MNLKILHICPYYLPDVGFGGPVFSVSALCDALVAKGAEVTVFTVGYDRQAEYPLTKNMQGVTVRYFRGDWGSPCQFSWQLLDALEKDASEFDLVHVHTWWNILVFQSIAILKKMKVPVVLSPRGMMSNYSFSHRKTWLKRWFQAFAGSKLVDNVHLHATAPAEATDMAARCHRDPSEIMVLPNLLALKEAGSYQEPPERGYTLGFLSRLHHKKGIEVLLEAVAQCPEVETLVIGGAGEADYELQLKQQAEKLGITHKIRYEGWISRNRKEAFFKTFEVFILPSFNENFANVVAEAWAAGKPTVVSDQVGLSDYVEKYDLGWVCQPSVASTAEAIRKAWREKSLWRKKGEAAIELVKEQFTDEQIINHYLGFYQSLSKPSVENLIQSTDTAPVLKPANPISKPASYVLGINAFHADASAALFHNGKLVAAIEEERFRRVKHWAGFPSLSIVFCLEQAGITLEGLSHIAIGRDPKAKWAQKARFALRHPGAVAFAMRGRLSNAASAVSVESELSALAGENKSPLRDKIVYVEHHRSHLASAFYASPFREAALLSVDGSGDFSTTMMGVGRDNRMEVLQSIDFPHSLGIFYTAFTQLLGFPYYGDEYKVMGLAPYGKPVYVDQLREVILLQDDGTFRLSPDWFRPPEKGYVLYDDSHLPQVPILYSRQMEERFGPVRQKEEPVTDHHRNLAASVQQMTEEVIFHMLNYLHRQTGLDAVCIAGGVAQNSVANGKITRNTPFKKVFVPPAGHDAGLSIGAALYLQHQLLNMPRSQGLASPYTGTGYSNKDILGLLQEEPVEYQRAESFTALCNEVADSIAGGAVVGWFRGKCEFGPRALGNRSILADPRRADAKELLNRKIKRRENFRPFAPSILKEFTADYFEMTDEVPYMEKVFVIRPEKREVIPAVTHVDGTGRLQTVSRELNNDYYSLIDTFRQRTGIPILLNTSFNENEPIVNSPREALDCFLRTNMDLLVLEDFIIKRPQKE